MAGRFEFLSPGAAVTDSLTTLLAERKAEERQKLLDQLAQNADRRATEAAQENVRMNNENIANQKIHSTIAQQQAAQSAEEAGRQKLTFASKFMKQGDDPEALGWKPELIEQGDAAGMWQKTPGKPTTMGANGVPSLDVKTGGDPLAFKSGKETRGFIGTPEEREKSDRKKAHQAQIEALSQDPAKKDIANFYKTVAAMNGGLVPDDAWQMLTPDVPYYVQDDETNTTTKQGTLPYNAKVGTRGYRPREPREPAESPLWIGKDKDGKDVWVNNRTFQKINMPEATRPTTGARGSTPQDLGISLGTQDRIHEAAGKLEPNGGIVNSLTGGYLGAPAGIPEEALQNFRTEAHKLIADTKASNRVKDLVLVYINSGRDEFLKRLGDIDIPEQDETDLDTIIGELRIPLAAIEKNRAKSPVATALEKRATQK